MTDLLHGDDDGPSQTRTLHVDCCIVGGGPAGMMLGLLLARGGVDVAVLEKHGDFLRDFRGDTVHPATLQLLDELGLLAEFEALEPALMERVDIETERGALTLADFTRLPGHHRHIAFVPQWDFLDLLARHASQHGTFRLLMSTEARDLLVREGRVEGVAADGVDGTIEVRAALVVAADGRHSVTRTRAGLDVVAGSPEVDVLWFRLSRHRDDRVPFLKRSAGAVLVGIDRRNYWQLAYVIPKGSDEALRQQPIASFREAIASLAPDLRERVAELEDWDDVKLLTVRVDRLRRWYRPGFLAIGDAAHAMSPAGGVGINLAIQDAVATANIVGPALQKGRVAPRHLRRVQRRRQLPTRIMQRFQVRALRGLYPSASNRATSEPLVLAMVRRLPALAHLMGRFIGLGLRREHVRFHGAGSRTRSAAPSPATGELQRTEVVEVPAHLHQIGDAG